MPVPSPNQATQGFAAALAGIDEALDWSGLGRVYCHEGGESFFAPEQREAIRDTGLALATDLQRALAQLPPESPGRSLWMGAAVAEHVPILFDHILLERDVIWRNLDGFEFQETRRAFARVEEEIGLSLPAMEEPTTADSGPFDLLWVVSVFSDPDAFPALHDLLYERSGTELATGAGNLRAETAHVKRWAFDLLSQLSTPGVLVTSDEELPFFLEAATEQSLHIQIPDQGRLSGVVGDVIRFCSVSASSMPL